MEEDSEPNVSDLEQVEPDLDEASDSDTRVIQLPRAKTQVPSKSKTEETDVKTKARGAIVKTKTQGAKTKTQAATAKTKPTVQPTKPKRAPKKKRKVIVEDPPSWNPMRCHDPIVCKTPLMEHQVRGLEHIDRLDGRALIAFPTGKGKSIEAEAASMSYFHNYCLPRRRLILPLLNDFLWFMPTVLVDLVFEYAYDLCGKDEWPSHPFLIITKVAGQQQFKEDFLRHWDLAPECIRVWNNLKFPRGHVRPKRVKGESTVYTADDTELMLSTTRKGRAFAPWVEILTHAAARSHVAWLLRRGIRVIACDESHVLKNHMSQITRAMTQLFHQASRLLLLSATPMDRPIHMWTQVMLLNPSLFPSRENFVLEFCSPNGVPQVFVNPYTGREMLRDGGTNQRKVGELHRLLIEHVLVTEDMEPCPNPRYVRRATGSYPTVPPVSDTGIAALTHVVAKLRTYRGGTHVLDTPEEPDTPAQSQGITIRHTRTAVWLDVECSSAHEETLSRIVLAVIDAWSTPKRHSVSRKASTTRVRSTSPRKEKTNKKNRSVSPKKIATKRKQSTSPKREVSKRQRSTSPKREARKRQRSISPKRKVITSRSRSASPKKKITTKRSRSTSPKKVTNKHKRSVSPRKKVKTKRSRSISPKKRISERQRSTSPKRKVVTKRSRSTSPKKIFSKRKRSVSPKKKVIKRKRSPSPNKGQIRMDEEREDEDRQALVRVTRLVAEYLLGDEALARQKDLEATMQAADRQADTMGTEALAKVLSMAGRPGNNHTAFGRGLQKTEEYRLPAVIRFLDRFIRTKLVAKGCDTNKVSIYATRHATMDAVRAFLDSRLDALDKAHPMPNGERKARSVMIRAGVSSKARDRALAYFAQEPLCRGSILGFQSGGTSIEVTAANYQILIGLCANASEVYQVFGRLVRISQKRDVTVYILLLSHSMDKIIFGMVKRKGSITSRVVHDREDTTEINEDSFRGQMMFELD